MSKSFRIFLRQSPMCGSCRSLGEVSGKRMAGKLQEIVFCRQRLAERDVVQVATAAGVDRKCDGERITAFVRARYSASITFAAIVIPPP